MPPRIQSALVPFRDALVAHRWLFAVTFAYVVVCVAIAASAGRLASIDFAMYGAILPTASTILAGLVALHCFYRLVRQRPERPILFLARELRGLATPTRLAAAVPIFVAVPVFMSVFTSMKMLVPVLNPYHWDPALIMLDRALHGGMDPWRLLQPIFGNVAATATLGWCYQIWFLLVFGTWYLLAFSTGRPRLRMQYFIAAVLTWGCVGTFGAILLSSVGPVYYGRVYGGVDPFAPLMDYLRQVQSVTPLFALKVQQTLWDTYTTGGKMIGSGISAMPSMHVSAALLFALLLRGIRPALGRIGFVYVGLIMIGSVHLGWHYAVDGYASVAITLVLWRFAGWITRQMPEFADPRAAQPTAPPLPA